MKKIKNIVVGFDVSKAGIEVLKRAFLLAKQKNAKLTIIHAIEDTWLKEFFSKSNKKKIENQIRNNIIKQINKINLNKIKYSLKVKKDKPSNLITTIAQEIKADLVVIGANTKDDFKNKVFGSNAHKIAQDSRLPILIVKNSCKKDYSKILAFTDLSDMSSNAIIFADNFFNDKEIKVIYAYKQASDFNLAYYDSIENKEKIKSTIYKKENKKFKEFKKKNNIKNGKMIESCYSINNALYEASKKQKSDLTILSSKGVNNATSFIHGSTTSSLMRKLQNDVLIYVP